MHGANIKMHGANIKMHGANIKMHGVNIKMHGANIKIRNQNIHFVFSDFFSEKSCPFKEIIWKKYVRAGAGHI
jgi:hypothetical protein